MNEDNLNMSIRKFLKMVGVRSQHEIEQAIASALAEKKLHGNETLAAKMTLRIGEVGLSVDFEGMVSLE